MSGKPCHSFFIQWVQFSVGNNQTSLNKNDSFYLCELTDVQIQVLWETLSSLGHGTMEVTSAVEQLSTSQGKEF